jgi:Outer membrane protein beta-barrel domain
VQPPVLKADRRGLFIIVCKARELELPLHTLLFHRLFTPVGFILSEKLIVYILIKNRLYMRLVFIVICSLALPFYSLAQQNQVGFFAGPHASTADYKVNNVSQSTSMKYGFQGGMLMKVPFENRLFFAPAVFYSLKGYKVKLNGAAYPPDVNAVDNNTTIHSVELAALLQVDLGSKPSHFFIKGGPTLDFLLFGKEKFNLNSGTSVSRNMKWGPGEYGHYAANVIAQFGYESNSGIFVFGQYTYGLTTINNADGGPRIGNRIYGISFGTYLKRKKIIIDTRNRE